MNKLTKDIIKKKYSNSKIINGLITKIKGGYSITKEEKQEIFFYLRHIPNYYKTEEEWELYCKMAKEKGLPEPDRNSRLRPLHEKR